MSEPDTVFPAENPETTVWEIMTQIDIDPLTNLPNRKRGEEDLKKYIKRSEQNGKILAVVFIDADKFKPINETYGHAYGDLIMVDLARSLNESFRPQDEVVRYAGDEFYAICPDFDTSLGREEIEKRVKEKIRETLEARDDFLSRAELKNIGATVGVAYRQEGDDPKSLVKRADEEMNKIKKLKHAKSYGE